MFYEQFESLCKKNGTTPTEFTTKVLKLSSSKVTAWKNGSIPKYGILESISQYFGVTVGYLFDGEIKKAAVLSVESSDTKKEQLIKNYELLNDEGQEDLLDYSEMLASNPRKIKESNNSVQMNA